MHGVVIRARGGDRAAYAPIETPLARSSDPVDVARGYLTLYPFRRLYVADLDGIEGRERCTGILARLRAELPLVELWVDNGMSKREDCSAFAGLDLGRLVLGSESQSDPALPLASGGVLSLDFRGETFLGPRALLDDPDLWPQDVIVMTLARVGALGRARRGARCKDQGAVVAPQGVCCGRGQERRRSSGAARRRSCGRTGCVRAP